MVRTVVMTDPDGASTVTVKQVNDFQRGYRRDLTVFKHLNGAHIMWFMSKRNGAGHANVIKFT
eukprot:8931718-Ditylum_brightwellii.AAC.1